MTLPVIADTARCAFNWVNGDGQTAKNIIHFADTGHDALLLAEAIDAAFEANMADATVNSANCPDVDVTYLDGVSATINRPLTRWVGQIAGQFVPQASAILTLYTVDRGRSNRGRIYLPFIAEGVLNNGLLGVDTVGELNTGWLDFQNAMFTAGFPVVVASYITEHTVHGAPAGASVPHRTDVVRIKAQPVAGTQRRRQSRLRTA